MNFFQKLFSSAPSVNLKSIIDNEAFLVDVRTPNEFAAGHVKGSVNIPLDRLQSEISKFNHKKKILVFCRSGNRSAQAKAILEQAGIANVYNAGTWNAVQKLIANL